MRWEKDGEYLWCKEVNYGVHLTRCNDSHQVLDWIFQIFKKRWATPEVMYSLLEAIEEELDPQNTLCGMALLSKPVCTCRKEASHEKD